MKIKSSSREHFALLPSARGATMLEFAFALPILILIAFAIVDFSRFYAVSAVLRAGAEEGLNRARKIPNFDLDWRGLPPTDRNWLRFTQARDRILDISERNPLATLVAPSGSSSDTTLLDMTVTYNGLNQPVGDPPPSVTRGAAVLRPGDCVAVAGHGTICDDPQGADAAPLRLMEGHPIRIVLMAQIRPFLPFLDPLIAHGEAFGYRERIPPAPIDATVEPEDVGGGNPGSPLPPVLPGAGSKEPPPVYLTCTPGSAGELLAHSVANPPDPWIYVDEVDPGDPLGVLCRKRKLLNASIYPG